MRAFIVLCCLATTYAASVGYDYDRPGAGGISSFGSDQSFNGGAGGSNGVGGSFGGNDGGSTFGSSNLGGSLGGNNGGSSFGNNNIGSAFGDQNGGSNGFGSNPAGVSGNYGTPAEFTKEFYSYTAPEGAFDDAAGIDQLGNSLKRGLRVIFIKNPENTGLENAALQLAKSAGDQRTAIYVLNKQADIGDLANKLNNLNKNNNSKPEVHFVKYRTPADAENAKRAIQAQYDALGGKSNNFNGGVAPVLDFASKSPAGSYLPPAKRV